MPTAERLDLTDAQRTLREFEEKQDAIEAKRIREANRANRKRVKEKRLEARRVRERTGQTPSHAAKPLEEIPNERRRYDLRQSPGTPEQQEEGAESEAGSERKSDEEERKSEAEPERPSKRARAIDPGLLHAAIHLGGRAVDLRQSQSSFDTVFHRKPVRKPLVDSPVASPVASPPASPVAPVISPDADDLVSESDGEKHVAAAAAASGRSSAATGSASAAARRVLERARSGQGTQSTRQLARELDDADTAEEVDTAAAIAEVAAYEAKAAGAKRVRHLARKSVPGKALKAPEETESEEPAEDTPSPKQFTSAASRRKAAAAKKTPSAKKPATKAKPAKRR